MPIIHTTADSFLEIAARQPAGTPAVMKEALLVSPEGFGLSEQSAADNPYMTTGLPLNLDKASRQHEALVSKLEELGVKTRIFSGIAGQDDGVFPNNVFAAAPGRLVIGSMRHPVRRKEAEREDIRAFFSETLGYEIRDLSIEACIAEMTSPRWTSVSTATRVMLRGGVEARFVLGLTNCFLLACFSCCSFCTRRRRR